MNEILAAVDLDRTAAVVLEFVAALAGRLGARAHIVHVAPPDPDFVGYDAGPPSVREAVAEELRDEHRDLYRAVRALRARGVDAGGRLLRGPTVETILAEAERLDAGAIVVGRHSRGPLTRAILGSTSATLMRRAGRPVLVVPPARP